MHALEQISFEKQVIKKDCLSFTGSFKAICGLTLLQFGALFGRCQNGLQELFPKCFSMLLEGGTKSSYSSLRIKLFFTLFRMKQACTFRFMESVFGWAKSALKDNFTVVLKNLRRNMHFLHEGIFETLTAMRPDWQLLELKKWEVQHLLTNDMDSYKERVSQLINHAALDNQFSPFESAVAYSSLGAVDGTYSIRPSFTTKVDEMNNEDVNKDTMYSQYIRAVANKLLIFVTHAGLHLPKLILKVNIAASWFGT